MDGELKCEKQLVTLPILLKNTEDMLAKVSKLYNRQEEMTARITGRDVRVPIEVPGPKPGTMLDRINHGLDILNVVIDHIDNNNAELQRNLLE